MFKNSIILSFLIFYTLQLGDQQTLPAVTIISLTDFKEAVIGKDVQLIDIRTPKEYAAGFIDDAVNIPIANKDQFVNQFLKLDKEQPIYIYCYSGIRSHRAANMLVDLGFTKIYDFKGGWKAWSNQ